ncbi:MAG: hypothetical protein R2785_09515 [Flavobacteriaceae bacterium]
MKKYFKHILLTIVILTYSCNNESVDLTTISADDAIMVNSEVYNNIERVVDEDPENNLVCLDFIYAFTLNIFDENLELTGSQIIQNDSEFSNLLSILEDGYSISLSYPINGLTSEGEIVEITNNEELKAVIDNCLKDEVINYCSGQLSSPECVWKVIYNEDGNNNFEDAYFDVDELGTVEFYYDDNIYSGTWINLFIGDELHLNISLIDTTFVAESWNFDWKVTIIDSDNMKLEYSGTTFYIKKECEEEPCIAFEFEECELNQDEGIAEFYLEEYIECVTNFIEYEVTENTIITFHETTIDAENNINPLPTTPFINTINPQILIIRIENTETNEVQYASIHLTAIDCED